MTLYIVYMYVTYDNSQFETSTEQSVPARRQAYIESVFFFFSVNSDPQ